MRSSEHFRKPEGQPFWTLPFPGVSLLSCGSGQIQGVAVMFAGPLQFAVNQPDVRAGQHPRKGHQQPNGCDPHSWSARVRLTAAGNRDQVNRCRQLLYPGVTGRRVGIRSFCASQITLNVQGNRTDHRSAEKKAQQVGKIIISQPSHAFWGEVMPCHNQYRHNQNKNNSPHDPVQSASIYVPKLLRAMMCAGPLFQIYIICLCRFLPSCQTIGGIHTIQIILGWR